ncbi:MAG: tetratricopeptide repeat protein [Phycisphaeraceae bacterium]|nr:tetratricopeptide repeat protein [Phycisphaeraceae bacterium]
MTDHPASSTASSASASRRAPGGRRLGGLLMVVLVIALAAGLVVIIKTLASPQSPAEAAAAGSGLAGAAGAKQIEETLAAARQAMSSREYDKAAALLARTVEANPNDQELRVAYGEALMAQNKFSESFAQYDRATGMGQPNAKLHFIAGTIANKAGRLDRAEDHYSMAQRLDPRIPDYSLYLAMIQLKREEPTAAAKNLLMVVQMQPGRAEAWGTLGEIYMKDDKLTIALQNTQKARELQPEVLRWRLNEARIIKRQNDPQKAATILLALDDAQRRQDEVMALLAECYGMLSKPAEAARMFSAAASDSTGPEAGAMHYQAALWFQRAKDLPHARESAQAAADLGNADAKELLADLE